MSITAKLILVAISASLALHTQHLHGQAERPVRWTLTPSTESDTAVDLKLKAEIDSGWYLYSAAQPPGGPIAMQVEPAGEYVLISDIQAPTPRRYADRNFNIFSQIYETEAEFSLRLRRPRVAATAPALHIRYQACTRRYCLPPRTDTVDAESGRAALPEPLLNGAEDPALSTGTSRSAPAVSTPATAAMPELVPGTQAETVAISPLEAGTDPTSPTRAEPLVAGPGSFATKSLAGLLWLAAGMGLLSLLSPCVFPMVPVTVGFFTRDKAAERTMPVITAGAYAIGIVITFTATGFAVATLAGASGVVRMAASPWLNLLVGCMFLAFALNLLGVYQVSLPSTLIQRVSRAGADGPRPMAAFAMGSAFAVTSFTCTAPFVGTLLVLAAQGGWTWPIAGLAVYASAFAFPFLLLALAPGLLQHLPRSGSWMVTLRQAIGIIEIAAATKFISNADLVWKWDLLSREAMIGIWVAALVALTAVFLAHSIRTRRRWGHRSRPALFLSCACVTLGLALSRSFTGLGLGELEAFLPPARNAPLEAGMNWKTNDYAHAFATAQREGKPLFVDFTGYTCTNCRWMEANMFTRPEVAALLQEFELVRLYTDGQGQPYEAQQKFQEQRFGTVALPYYAVMDAAGNTVGVFLGMTRNPEEFTAFLRNTLAADGVTQTGRSRSAR